MKKRSFIASALALLVILSCFPLLHASAAAAPYVASDTPKTISRTVSGIYQFKFTVHGTHAKPKIAVGNGRVLKVLKETVSKDKSGNDVYYYRIQTVGKAGSGAGVYTTLPGKSAVRQCVVNVTEKTIPYRNLYAGFVKDEKGRLPQGDVLIQTQKDWDAFMKKYFPLASDINYRYDKAINFSKDAILYHFEYTSAKEDVFVCANPISKVVVVNGKPAIEEGQFGNNFKITTMADSTLHYVVMVLVKKADIK